MKKHIVLLILTILPFITTKAQKFPIVTNNYDLDLSIDFSQKKLNGVCQIELENTSDSTISEIPILLYRLMKIEYVKDFSDNDLLFQQNIIEFSDFPLLQVNSVSIKTTILPHQKKVLKLKYNGYLIGYSETGMKYIKDRISPEFTLIRNDAYSYPLLAKPSLNFLRQNINHNFNYTINVTVPDSLMVANGGILLNKEKKDDLTTYTYRSKKPNWRIDIAIAPYKMLSTDRIDIFYYNDSIATKALADYGMSSFALYEKWWGKLRNDNTITVIETEKGSGGQADETTILLPYETFTNKAHYDQLYHELSHLWNVKIIENKGLSPRWEEGLATFSQYLVTEKLEDEKGYLKRVTNRNINWLKSSFKKNPILLETPMIEFGDKQLTNYSYVQGMIIFCTLYYWLGENKFNQVIRDFYQTYYSKGASTEQFTDMWYNIIKNKRIKSFFNDWVYTTNYINIIEKNMNIDDIINYYTNISK